MFLVELPLFLIGLLILVRGKMFIPKGRVLEGESARLVGFMLMFPLIGAFGFGFIDGYLNAREGPGYFSSQIPIYLMLEIGLVVVCLALAFNMVNAAEPKDEEDAESASVEPSAEAIASHPAGPRPEVAAPVLPPLNPGSNWVLNQLGIAILVFLTIGVASAGLIKLLWVWHDAEALQSEREERAKRLARPLAAIKIPQAVGGTETLAGRPIRDRGLRWSALPFGSPPDSQDHARLPFMVGAVWAEDGESFHALDRTGVLRHVAYPGLKEIRKIELGQVCFSLGACKPGLILTLPELQEVWIIDRDTLAVTRRVGVNNIGSLLTGPSLEYAYLFADSQPFRLNLADGTVAPMVLTAAPGFKGFGYANLTPDGKYLFADGGLLTAYKIDNLKLTFKDQSNEQMGSGNKEGICISPDSQWVCFPTGGGNEGASYGTYIYRTDDLSKPAFLMKQGAYPEVVGFDPPHHRFFSQNGDHYLLIFDDKGRQLGAYGASQQVMHKVRQYAARPTDGRALLLRTVDQLFLIEFMDGAMRN